MDNKRPFLPVKYDIIFRLFFADERNIDELVCFLKSILKLHDDDYNEIEIADPNLLIDYVGDKNAIIDIKLYTKSRKVIHIEIQLEVSTFLKRRIIFYNSKLVTEQLGFGNDYENINKVISIVITKEKLISNSLKYHHSFLFYDSEADVEFTDIVEIHTLELCKLPKITDGTTLYDWARFINAETEEELLMSAENNPQIQKAVVKLRTLSADERARDMLERREKGRRDFHDFMMGAKAEGKTETINDIAIKLIKLNMPIKDIMVITELTYDEIEKLKSKSNI